MRAISMTTCSEKVTPVGILPPSSVGMVADTPVGIVPAIPVGMLPASAGDASAKVMIAANAKCLTLFIVGSSSVSGFAGGFRSIC